MPATSVKRWVGASLLFLAAMGVAVALTAVLSSLPAPAAGGTCGPSRGSESALEAFFNPVSIGAGPAPPARAGTAARLDWLAFIGECQSATDARILSGLGILVLSAVAAVVGVRLLRRRPESEESEELVASRAAPPGWYPDPEHSSSGYRWWDGRAWGPSHPPPGAMA